jgi:hypothetical protein
LDVAQDEEIVHFFIDYREFQLHEDIAKKNR